MDIGSRIHQRRKELKMNADYIAERIGVSRSTVFRYENGDIEKVPTQVLEKLADILNTTPEFLMGWDDDVENIMPIYSILTKENKSKVYDFANYQLQKQNNEQNSFDPE